jgi:SAM-dependent methyltransferase
MLKTVNIRADTKNILDSLFEQYLKEDMIVYDIGCGNKPFSLNVKEHVCVDYDDAFYGTDHLDIVADAYDVPVENEVADAVISSQVLEHLERPEDAIKETYRLLKPDGLFFISVPFLSPIHAAPYDFSRMTEFQLVRYLNENGFEILDLRRLGGIWYLLGSFLVLYVQPIDRGFLKKLKISTFLLWFVRWVFYQFHLFEGFILKLAKKDLENIRREWTANYIILAKKKAL